MTQITATPGSAANSSAATHPLVQRLTRLRGRVRAVIGMFGTGVLVAAAIGGMVVLMFGDYLFHFSSPLRFVLLIAWLVSLAALAWRFLINPLSTRLTDQFLAGRVENLHKDLADELISAVHFIHAGTIQTNALAARHVDAAAAKTASIKFDEAVDFKRSLKAAGVGLLVVVIAGGIYAVDRADAHIALSRWFSTSPMPWPHSTTVEFAWPEGNQPAVVPIGEQLLVRAKVVRGGYPTQRVYLTFWGDNKSARTEQMTYQPGMSSGSEFIYEYTLEPEGEKSLSLKLQAGDDREQEPVTLRLAARPMVRELMGSIAPPAYVKDVKDPTKAAAPMLVDLLSQSGRAVEGGTVTLTVRSSKPYMTDEDGRPEIRLMDQLKDVELVPGMTRNLVSPEIARVSFPASKTMQARVMVRDTDGFDNRAGGTMSLEVVPDGLPSVVITEPKREADRAPDSSVKIETSATDDLGLDHLKIVAEKFDAKLGDPPVFTDNMEWTDRTVDAAVGSTTGHSTYTWDLSSLKLQPGARLSFYAMVQDNYDVGGKRHPWVKSAPLTLQIMSPAQLLEKARNDLNRDKEEIKVLDQEQQITKEKVDVIKNAVAQSGVSTPQQKQQLAELTQQQSQETQSAKNIQQKVEQTRSDLAQNKLADSDMGKLAASVSEGMKDVGENNMTKAKSDLNKAQEAAGNKDKEGAKADEKAKEEAQQAADAAKSASTQQSEAIAKMDNMINQLGAAGDLEAAKSALQQDLKKQNELADRNTKLAPQIAGKDPSQLTPDQKAALAKQAAEQQALAQQTQATIDSMKKSAERMKNSNTAASQSMASAAKAGEKSDTAGAQSAASSSLSKARTSSAAGSQSQAKAGLQEMIDQLNENEKRELEELQKKLAKLIEQVTKLRDDEVVLNKDTTGAGAKAVEAAMTKLGDRQGTLQMNTIVVEKVAEGTKDAQKAAADVRDAGDHMGEAAAPLYASKQPAALDPETQAIASLNDAIAKLQEQKDKADQEAKEKDLAAFVKEYEAIKKSQQDIKTASDKVEAARLASADHQIDRLGVRDVERMSKDQKGLIDHVNQLSADPKLKIFDVVVWMNGQIADAMDDSKDDLAKAQTGMQLASAQQTAIDRLDDVIQALKEEKPEKSKFKKESSGGGGGSGGGGKKPLIPPIAEVKMIRAMQDVVNKQTVAINKAIAEAKTDTDKAQLMDQAAKIGKTQGELKGIVQKMMKDLK